MITIRHEGHGPYVERTIIDYGGIRNYTEVPDADMLEAVVTDPWGDTPENLRERIKELEQRAETDREDRLAEIRTKEEELESLEAELADADDRLNADDPGAAMREEIRTLRARVESLSARYDGVTRAHQKACEEINQLRASIRAGQPKIVRKRAVCACGGFISNRTKYHPAKCIRCGTLKGETPNAELLARVKELDAA
jgi:hypothetical protein